MYFVIAVLVAVALGAIFLSVRKYPRTKELLPWIDWLVQIISTSFGYWGFKKRYKDQSEYAAKFALLLTSVIANDGTELRETRESVAALLDAAYTSFNSGKELTEIERSIIVAAYVTAISYDDITESLASVWKTHDDLDVRKATLVVIDIFGELVYLKDKLGQQYFQHVVYGLNKCLKLLRDNGTEKRNLKEITGTLFRVYKLTKAYRLRRKLSGMEAGELYDKIIDLIEHMAYVVTVK